MHVVRFLHNPAYKSKTMKTLIFSFSMLLCILAASAQDVRKASTTGAVRLFGDKEDLTSVISIVPSGSIVEVIKSDTLYTLIRFENNEGYVKSDRLSADIQTVTQQPASAAYTSSYDTQYQATAAGDRYSGLVARYGSELAKPLYMHKIWKGATAQMARDSWGKPKQVNRMYVDQSVDEEWVYSKKWLYFRDGILIEWGPVK